MVKKYIVWRILFMIFSAAISVIGVWTNIKLLTIFGVISWIISTIINLIYSHQEEDIKSV